MSSLARMFDDMQSQTAEPLVRMFEDMQSQTTEPLVRNIVPDREEEDLAQWLDEEDKEYAEHMALFSLTHPERFR